MRMQIWVKVLIQNNFPRSNNCHIDDRAKKLLKYAFEKSSRYSGTWLLYYYTNGRKACNSQNMAEGGGENEKASWIGFKYIN